MKIMSLRNHSTALPMPLMPLADNTGFRCVGGCVISIATDNCFFKIFFHIMPVGYAHADRDPVRGLPEGTRLTQDGVDAWLDKAKLHGERSLH